MSIEIFMIMNSSYYYYQEYYYHKFSSIIWIFIIVCLLFLFPSSFFFSMVIVVSYSLFLPRTQYKIINIYTKIASILRLKDRTKICSVLILNTWNNIYIALLLSSVYPRVTHCDRSQCSSNTKINEPVMGVNSLLFWFPKATT